MEEFKAKSHAVKKMTRKGLVETESREGTVKETAEAKSDGRRINEGLEDAEDYEEVDEDNEWMDIWKGGTALLAGALDTLQSMFPQIHMMRDLANGIMRICPSSLISGDLL